MLVSSERSTGMKIAEIILNTEVRSLDRVYHYYLEDGTQAEPGVRVEVPFGNGNRTAIGYIVGFTESSPFTNLKSIKRVLDSTPLISYEGLELARHIRKTTLCPMSEAIRLMLPPSVNFKFERIVMTLQDNGDNLTALQKKVMETLISAGGKVEQKKLLQACGVKSASVISALEKKGFVEITEKAVGGFSEKIRKKVYPLCSPEEVPDNLGPSMKKAMDMLLRYECMFLSELLEYCGCSASSVQALKKRGLIDIRDVSVKRSPVSKKYESSSKMTPTGEQKLAIETVVSRVEKRAFSEFLLFGVTGSGKTEVFLQAVEKCIAAGRNAVILVPEIALTPQMTARFISRFGNRVAVLHSGLSLGERYDEWNRIKSGEVCVALGARSAIFAPFENIGLIVIDEEHESTYKSESSPKYDARRVAAFRAKQYGCPVVYASATPRVEDFYAAKTGKMQLLHLSKRVNNRAMPKVITVDMAQELAQGNRSVYSLRAISELEKNLKSSQQSIVFLNRRGFSTFVSCRSCGYVAKCPNCSVSLTYHARGQELKCHICGFSMKNPEACPECTSKYIRYFGAGTQKAEEELVKNFPYASYVRMDADTTSHKFSHERILDKFKNEKLDVLLGTQMVTKGLDFPDVTLSVVLAADALLNTGDYNASEKAFAQLVQVCGRAGRGEKEGRAVVQTYDPKNKVIAFAARADYEAFYEDEIISRKLMEYPPFSELVLLTVTGEDEQLTGQYGMRLELRLRELLAEYEGLCIAFFGLAPATTFKVKNRFRYRLLFKTVKNDGVYDILETLYNEHIENKTAFGLDIDISPNSCL